VYIGQRLSVNKIAENQKVILNSGTFIWGNGLFLSSGDLL
jgi:hypothetical protein